ncbi:hypothetical protein [Egicoccus sp. AB-alg2]|uniref:hypothetical protein n=1 Tax=Egicoccus sp. AB-alg2 TaxID=3242693 RepID=UPI00359DA612
MTHSRLETVRTSTSVTDRAPIPPTGWRVEAARASLARVLAAAASADFDDAAGWARLRAQAHAATAVLWAAGVLPPHLRIRHGDPPVVVARGLARAWRHASLAA